MKCFAVLQEGATTGNLISWPLYHDTPKAERQCCLAMTLLSDLQTLQKWKMAVSSSVANVIGKCVTKYYARRAPMERG